MIVKYHVYRFCFAWSQLKPHQGSKIIFARGSFSSLPNKSARVIESGKTILGVGAPLSKIEFALFKQILLSLSTFPLGKQIIISLFLEGSLLLPF